MDENIRKLDLHEHILTRPGMYIGRNWDAEAIGVLITELCDLAIRPDHANECSNLKVVIVNDNIISIIDDGRGLPVEITRIDQSVELPKIEHIFLWLMPTRTTLSYHEKFGFLSYLSVVLNNVSSQLEIETRFDGIWYRLMCSRGKITEKLHKIDGVISRDKGTQITFTPDPLIFTDFKFDFERLLTGMTELKHEYPKINLSIEDNRTNKTVVVQASA
ncbi:MAG: hypothetical protein GC179_02430 [Anaerolineaceae bacterium]|nr:hypothetical protein [Anaerolineaceae bacterium]